MRRGRWLAGSILAVVAGGAIWAWVPPRFDQASCERSRNAAWISVDWTSKPVIEAEVRDLARHARTRRLAFVYPYVSYFRERGASFTDSYTHAADFLETFKRHAPGVKVIAWIGIPLRPARAGGVNGWVDLSDPARRGEIAAFVSGLLSRYAFDGVQLDVETVSDGDPDFLRLLEAVRAAMPEGRTLGVAGNQLVLRLQSLVPFARAFGWSAAYYADVASRVDQIAVMAYDLHVPFGAAYRLWMREQARELSHALAGSRAEWLMGISVSREATASHRPEVESLENGLAGVCAGLGPEGRMSGLAIYADWEWDERDERAWNAWLR